MRNIALLSMVLVSSIVFASLIVDADAGLPCYCSGESCERDPGYCRFGETRVCGRRVCAKGPGERCGGPMDYLGRCSDNGLMCTSKEKCIGCYNNGYRVTCYTDDGVR